MIELLYDPQAWVSFLTLTVLEIVLGIDNIVFISILVGKLPESQAKRARQIGLGLALAFRILLLMALSYIIGLTAPLFTIQDQTFSWRDIVLIGGGLFLLWKSTREIHQDIEGEADALSSGASAAFGAIVIQIIIIDMIFSIDSIITAVGIADHVEVMIAAVIIAVIIMYAASGPIAEFIRENPTTKMLALAFLLLIGVALIADGFGLHIPRGYIYFAMAFSGMVEMFNILAQRRRGEEK
ncbi:MAG TPA: TerC family protein [Afifellaceae bacterium]|nr:TerC family protein [Afifellaceae bacterium]